MVAQRNMSDDAAFLFSGKAPLTWESLPIAGPYSSCNCLNLQLKGGPSGPFVPLPNQRPDGDNQTEFCLQIFLCRL